MISDINNNEFNIEENDLLSCNIIDSKDEKKSFNALNEIEESKVPVVLKKYLEINKNIRTIILHLDNDIAGRNATKALEFLLKKDYEVLDRPSSYGKDVNDYLVHQMEEKNKKSRSYAR